MPGKRACPVRREAIRKRTRPAGTSPYGPPCWKRSPRARTRRARHRDRRGDQHPRRAGGSARGVRCCRCGSGRVLPAGRSQRGPAAAGSGGAPGSTAAAGADRRRTGTGSWMCCTPGGLLIWRPPRCGRFCSTRESTWGHSPRSTGCSALLGETRERRRQATHPAAVKPELVATSPNQVWSWDITKLHGPAKWTYYYLLVTWNLTAGWIVTDRHRNHVVKGHVARECGGEVARPGSARTSRRVAGHLDQSGSCPAHHRRVLRGGWRSICWSVSVTASTR